MASALGLSTGLHDLNDVHCMAAMTHPDEAPPVCPSLRLRRIEGRKRENKMGFTLFAAQAGERVGQRSVAGVSRSQRSKPMFVYTELSCASFGVVR